MTNQINVGLIRATPDPEELVCTAARNDYSSEGVLSQSYADLMASVEGETIDEKTDTLLKHVMHRGHWGVFEHPTATVALEGVSRVAMAQLTRHRQFSFDVQSLRYVNVADTDADALFRTPPSFTEENVTARDGVRDIDLSAAEREQMADGVFNHAAHHYEELTGAGVPQEDARFLLPMATRVNIVMTGNARAWLHLLNIRGKADAQWECREVVDALSDVLGEWMPRTVELFDEMAPMQLTP